MANTHYRLGNGPTRVIALLGWFGDFRIASEYTTEEFAQTALELADAPCWQRFLPIGHSMGGNAIQRVLVQAPERVGLASRVQGFPGAGR